MLLLAKHNNVSFHRNICSIFNGKELAQNIQKGVQSNIMKMKSENVNFTPKLVAIAVGKNPASEIYLEKKQEAAQVCGIGFDKVSLNHDTCEGTLLNIIREFNEDPTVNGVIVQLPLPSHMCEFTVCNSVSPIKDVDGFTQTSLGKLMQSSDKPSFVPCTALAVKNIISSLKCDTFGRNAVILGRSHNVGLPIQIILGGDGHKGGFDMTTTLCHRHTPHGEMIKVLRAADFIVSAAGVPELIQKDMVKEGCVIIDVGLSRRVDASGSNKVIGDVHRNVREVASIVTPVPGGVGPCTVACLMQNTFLAARNQMAYKS